MTEMLPIGLLMREHRLIEKMVESLKSELESITKSGHINPIFIDTAIDFFHTYADRTHHGKEEDILFRELSKKKLKTEDKKVMDELIQEHVYARKTVSSLLEAKDRYLKGDGVALEDVEARLKDLIELYPAHIEKEDRCFFYPTMECFTQAEHDAMLQEFYEFDRNMIHERYGAVVEKVRAQTKDFFLNEMQGLRLHLRSRQGRPLARGESQHALRRAS